MPTSSLEARGVSRAHAVALVHGEDGVEGAAGGVDGGGAGGRCHPREPRRGAAPDAGVERFAPSKLDQRFLPVVVRVAPVVPPMTVALAKRSLAGAVIGWVRARVRSGSGPIWPATEVSCAVPVARSRLRACHDSIVEPVPCSTRSTARRRRPRRWGWRSTCRRRCSCTRRSVAPLEVAVAGGGHALAPPLEVHPTPVAGERGPGAGAGGVGGADRRAAGPDDDRPGVAAASGGTGCRSWRRRGSGSRSRPPRRR